MGTLVDAGVLTWGHVVSLVCWLIIVFTAAFCVTVARERLVSSFASVVKTISSATLRTWRVCEALGAAALKRVAEEQRSDTWLAPLLKQLEAQSWPHTVASDGYLDVSVPAGNRIWQSVQWAGRTCFTPLVGLDNDAPVPDAISILTPAAGYRVAVLHRNGRCYVGLCARVPSGSRPSDFLSVMKRLSQQGFEVQKNLGLEQP
jgi:hypothetical protein